MGQKYLKKYSLHGVIFLKKYSQINFCVIQLAYRNSGQVLVCGGCVIRVVRIIRCGPFWHYAVISVANANIVLSYPAFEPNSQQTHPADSLIFLILCPQTQVCKMGDKIWPPKAYDLGGSQVIPWPSDARRLKYAAWGDNFWAPDNSETVDRVVGVAGGWWRSTPVPWQRDLGTRCGLMDSAR